MARRKATCRTPDHGGEAGFARVLDLPEGVADGLPDRLAR
jgi:hypothetical protein